METPREDNVKINIMRYLGVQATRHPFLEWGYRTRHLYRLSQNRQLVDNLANFTSCFAVAERPRDTSCHCQCPRLRSRLPSWVCGREREEGKDKKGIHG